MEEIILLLKGIRMGVKEGEETGARININRTIFFNQCLFEFLALW